MALHDIQIGPSYGIPFAYRDLRLNLFGNFGAGNSPPLPYSVTSAVLNYGILETDSAAPFSSWDLPVLDVSLSLIDVQPHQVVVPEGGAAVVSLAVGIVFVLSLKRLRFVASPD